MPEKVLEKYDYVTSIRCTRYEQHEKTPYFGCNVMTRRETLEGERARAFDAYVDDLMIKGNTDYSIWANELAIVITDKPLTCKLIEYAQEWGVKIKTLNCEEK